MSDTLADGFKKQGKYDNLSDYQQLKVASEMEREATVKLYEHLRRQHGESAAKEILKSKGYDPRLVRRA